MATVISLTEAKIRELLSGWEGVELSQDQINALVSQLWTSQATVTAEMDDLKNVVMPQLQTDLAESSIRVSELNDTSLPNLETELAQADAALQDLITVTIPGIEANLTNVIDNDAVRPKVYTQPDEPTNPDIDERGLLVGDTWFDADDSNKQYVWNGVEWSTFGVDIADFSLTAKKFKTSTHMLY